MQSPTLAAEENLPKIKNDLMYKEKKTVDRINSCLIERKSSEIINGEGVPIAITPEAKAISMQFLKNYKADFENDNELAGWNKFWAQEMAVAMIVNAVNGMPYQSYLPGRFLHYDLLANAISMIFSNEKKCSLFGLEILEAGCGSGLSLMRLAQRGASVSGLDWSQMALEFSRYLSNHFNVSNKVSLISDSYFNTSFENNKFDISYNSGVLEHLEADLALDLLKEMARITKSYGYILISVPNETSPFYKRFKEREAITRKNFSELVGIPVEHKRFNLNIKRIMEDAGLRFIKEDGLLVAPSTPVNEDDILETDLGIFETYLPKEIPLSAESKVAIWRGLKLISDADFRIRYGWSKYYIGQKIV